MLSRLENILVEFDVFAKKIYNNIVYERENI